MNISFTWEKMLFVFSVIFANVHRRKRSTEMMKRMVYVTGSDSVLGDQQNSYCQPVTHSKRWLWLKRPDITATVSPERFETWAAVSGATISHWIFLLSVHKLQIASEQLPLDTELVKCDIRAWHTEMWKRIPQIFIPLRPFSFRASFKLCMFRFKSDLFCLV